MDAAGICWSGMEREGRCSSVAALRVERGECCAGGARAPAAAWSPRDLDSGEIFFYKTLAGGVPCTACPGKSRFFLKTPKVSENTDVKYSFHYCISSGELECGGPLPPAPHSPPINSPSSWYLIPTQVADNVQSLLIQRWAFSFVVEPCAGVTCGPGRRCAVRDGRARCVCPASCRRAGPVCGSDGRTYRSLCRLRRRACRHPSKHLALDYPGRCQVGSCAAVRCGGDKRCVLDAELGAHCVRCSSCAKAGPPMCAVDGRTYAGTCALRQAACEQGRSLPLAYRGTCIANATCATIRCGVGQRCAAGGASGARCVSCGGCGAGGGGTRRRLCGSDRRTYASWCRLQRAACDRGQAVDPLHVGPCAGASSKISDRVRMAKRTFQFYNCCGWWLTNGDFLPLSLYDRFFWTIHTVGKKVFTG
ncbi:Follistatin [Eumeta japonica]|uniref:Follistatin n=1 Tax=Eumeta variegata TaxID=151549 RepID=A0A4C1XK45_EUMVA|nr:Follistatin [Eumeta japonica]